VAGEDARNVSHLSSRADTLRILNYLKSESPARAVIIGGGYIGMEIAEALRARGLDVTLVHRYRLPMAGLEQETREQILEELVSHDIHFVSNASVESLVQDKQGKIRHAVTTRGSFDCDLVILSLGVEPNVELAGGARSGSASRAGSSPMSGSKRARMACWPPGLLRGKKYYHGEAHVPSARNGGEQGGLGCRRKRGGGHATFKGAIRAIAVKVFGLEVAQVGLSSEEARRPSFR